MITGAIIGGVIGLAIVLFKNARKGKTQNNETLDSDLTEKKES